MFEMKLIAPSILSADFSRLGDEIRAVEAAGADWIHVDVMDGHFVPNITIGPLIVKAVKKATKLPLDVHLMIETPEKYIANFIDAGADYVAIHSETGKNHKEVLNQIRKLGAKPAIAINPATPETNIANLLDYVDMVVVMTVNPGFGGQKFIAEAQNKIPPLRKMIDKQKNKILIEADGGVGVDNIGNLSKLGVDVFVAGSAVFGSKDYKKTINEMRKKI